MRIKLESGAIWVDNLFFCYGEMRDGRIVQLASREVEVRYSHHAGRDRAFIDGIGWFGDDVVLSKVRNRDAGIPSSSCETRLVGLVERAQERGERITFELVM